MTAATAPARAGEGEGMGKGKETVRHGMAAGTRGLVRLVLRQHRTTAWIALGGLVAMLLALVTLRMWIVEYVRDNGLTIACTAMWGCGPSAEAVGPFREEYGDPLHYLGMVIQALPWLIGLFAAGPLIARELESGTYQLAWTQSVSPARWLAVKLAVPAVAVAAGVSLLSAVYTWTWRAVPADALPGQSWYQSYDMLGPAPVAHALLALSLGTLIGLLVQRTVAAMGGTLALYSALAGLMEWLRPRLTGMTTEMSAAMPGLIKGDAWVVERGMIDRTGGRIAEPDCAVGISPEECLIRHRAGGWYVDFHPSSHLWPLQWAETAMTVGLAALVAAVAVRLIRRAYP
ncbi:hypothetical protein [Streptomyces sp. NPDC053048]|uniref:hypothetical protein n=1 Tax=Streptomyces sp. NPDC053048 TaxID=3365694 RepID=UPI0037D58B8C